jgi:uroporphyrinogen-III synthase
VRWATPASTDRRIVSYATADTVASGSVTATVGVTAGRRAEEQALMFERAGLRVVIGPAMGTLLVTESGALREVTAALVARPPDYLIADTGIGIRSWIAAADGWGWREQLVDALQRARIACRGPKSRLLAEDLTGARVAVQLHGEDEPALIGSLTSAGADIVEVPVYRWTVPDDRRPALELIAKACEGTLEAITFTSAPAVHGLFDLARADGSGDALLDACNGRVLVACVGPVCGAAATEEGIAAPRWPDHWRLGSMVRLVVDALSVGRA